MKNRNETIDRVKGIAIILMVIGHVISSGFVHDFIYLFHMPVFLMIAGYFYSPPIWPNWFSFVHLIRKRFVRLWIPFASCAIIYIVFEQRDVARLLIRLFFFQSGHLGLLNSVWFLKALFLSTLLMAGMDFLLSIVFKQRFCIFIQSIISVFFLTVACYWARKVPYIGYIGGGQMLVSYGFLGVGRVVRAIGLEQRLMLSNRIIFCIIIGALSGLIGLNAVGDVNLAAVHFSSVYFVLLSSIFGFCLLFCAARICKIRGLVVAGRFSLWVLIFHKPAIWLIDSFIINDSFISKFVRIFVGVFVPCLLAELWNDYLKPQVRSLMYGVLSRGRVRRALMIVAYRTGVVHLFYWLNRQAKRVIVFHNVLPDDLYEDNVLNCASCSVSKFETIVNEVSRKFRFSTDFNDSKTVTITFDDGLKNQWLIAGRILKERNIPAVVFGSGTALAARRPIDCTMDDQLLFWSTYAPQSALETFARGVVKSRTYFWCKYLRPAYARDASAKGRLVWGELNEIFSFNALYASADQDLIKLRMLGLEQSDIDAMETCGWKMGWHTFSHYPLSSLDDKDAEREIKPTSEDMLSIPMCFPYGERMSVSMRDIKLAEQCGYPSALNCSNKAEDDLGQFFSIRMTLPQDRIGIHCMLSGFLYFLESGRLLRKADVDGD